MCIFVAATGMNIFSATHAAKPLAMVAWNWTSASNAAGGKNRGANNFFGARNFLELAMGGRGRLFRVFQLPFPPPPLWSELASKTYFGLSACLGFLWSPI